MAQITEVVAVPVTVAVDERKAGGSGSGKRGRCSEISGMGRRRFSCRRSRTSAMCYCAPLLMIRLGPSYSVGEEEEARDL